jgi:hypothetical protein
MDRGDRSHGRLQDEAERHWSTWPLDHVAPNALENLPCSTVPEHSRGEQRYAARNNQLGHKSKVLWNGIRHGDGPA